MNTQDWFPPGRTGWISLQSKGLKSLLQHHSSKASVLQCSAFFIVQLLYPYITTGRTIAFTSWTFVGKVMSLLFNMLSRLVIALLPKSKHLLISWLQSQSEVILGLLKIKSLKVSIVSHRYAMKWWDWMQRYSFLECWVLSKHFPSPLLLLSRGSLVLLCFMP